MDPIVSSRSQIAALMVGLRPSGPFELSLPLSAWVDFARRAKSTDWQAYTEFPLSIRETMVGLELVDASDTAIVCSDAHEALEEMAAVLNELAYKFTPLIRAN